jgi:hypothetical protein
MKGYDKKNLKPAPAASRANPAADKAAIQSLTQKISDKLKTDPQGASKAGKVLSDWLNSSAEKKPLKKAG